MSNDYNYKKLYPFKWFVLQNFPFIEDDIDGINNWKLLEKLGYEINKVIETLNDMGLEVQDLSDFINNLDLQEEVDKKLDEMADSGELAEIINLFIAKSEFTFDTVAEMKENENLDVGAKIKTFGYYEVNDKGGANYIVREKTGADEENGAIIFLADENLVAEIVTKDNVNALQFGCKNNGVNDTTTELQNFIDYCISKNITGIIPDGTYICNSSLEITNSIHLIGENMPIIKHTQISSDEQFIYITGSNITLENLHIRNQGHRINIIMGNDTYCGRLIYIYNAENIKFVNCKISDIYSYGIMVYYSKNLYFTNCLFKDATYNMLTFYQETENIYVDNCEFDGVYSANSSGNAYLLATGVADYDTLYNFRTKNLNVTNSHFKNNENWEGIDTHGCEGVYISNNKIENCKMGIMCVRDQRPITPCNHNNFTIENNIIVGTENEITGSYGINCGTNNTAQVKNFTIRNNKITRCGYNNVNSGSIIAQNIDNCLIDNNIIENTYARFIYIIGVTNGNITNNKMYNVQNKYNEDVGYVGILVRQRSIVNFANNYMNSANQLSTGVYSLKTIERGFVTENNNMFFNTLVNFDTFYLFEGDATNDVTGKLGTYTRDTYGNNVAYCTDPQFMSKLINRGRCAGNVGSNIITVTADAGFRNLLKGDKIQINGAGESGANLITEILEYGADRKLTIKDNIQTAVSTAAIFTLAATWVSLTE